MLTVGLVRDFDEGRLFGIRAYTERLREQLSGRCRVHDVLPWPRRSFGSGPLRSLETLFVKEALYPMQVRRVRADVAHVVDQSHAHLLRSLRSGPTVVTCHDLWGLRTGSRLRRAGYRRRVESLCAATRVIAVSESARREAIDLGVAPERIRVVRNRVERAFADVPSGDEIRAVAERFGVSQGGFVLHVGNSLPYKNLEGLLRALAEVRRRVSGLGPLVKVGASLTPAQRALAADLGVAVRELGEISIADLRAVYRLAACLAYPSLHEGFGWPVAEAVVSGCPVVASRSGSLPEVAGDAALFVDVESGTELADAIAELLANESARRELARRAQLRAPWLVDGDPGAEVLAVYQEAVESR